MADLRRFVVREGGVAFLPAEARELAIELSRLRVATVQPRRDGTWQVSGVDKVGVLRVGATEVHIEPKVPIATIFHLLARGRQWGTWFDEDVRITSIADLYPAIAQTFATWCRRLLARGALRGYVDVRRAEPTIRGRWLIAEQLRRRHGIPLPAELAYDDHTLDIPENRLVRAAARRLLAFDFLPDDVRIALRRVDRALADAVPVRRGLPAPQILFDRRNEHYRPLLALARLIHEGESIDRSAGEVRASGFLLDLARVFEDYIAAMVAAAVVPHGGVARSQSIHAFDADGRATIRPDLLWLRDGRPHAVFDAKYKAPDGGHPNADLYQALAYAIRFGLRSAHLIYAGAGAPVRYEIAGAGTAVVAHSVDLSKPPVAVDAQVAAVVEAASVPPQGLEP